MKTPLAFPSITLGDSNYNNPTQVYHPGMSLRDWFAGMALQGMLASPVRPENTEDSEVPEDMAISAWAAYSFKLADAMMAERAK